MKCKAEGTSPWLLPRNRSNVSGTGSSFICVSIQQIFVEGLSISRSWGAAAGNTKGHVSHGACVLVCVLGCGWSDRTDLEKRHRYCRALMRT